MPDYFGTYSRWAEEVGSLVQIAVAGRTKVAPQSPFVEAWLAMCLFYKDSLMRLDEIAEMADGINHALPNSTEVAWAFLRMKSRGWLDEGDALYGLTPDGRRIIGRIVGEGTVLERLQRLKEWTSSNEPPSH